MMKTIKDYYKGSIAKSVVSFEKWVTDNVDLNAVVKTMVGYKHNISKNSLQPLAGVPFSIKDNFATKGEVTAAGCNLLKNFTPNYNSYVFEKLISLGAVPLAKTTLDELAMGGTGMHSNIGIVKNPLNKERISGGSSGGSAAMVGGGGVPFSIGSDTGDSVRRPASYCGIVGFKPTWSAVSRWGMYDFAPSFDTVGWFTNTIEDSATLFNLLKGHDERDYTSYSKEIKDVSFKTDESKHTIGVIEEIYDSIQNQEIKKSFDSVLEKMGKKHNVVKLSIKKELLEAMLPCYMIIVFAEATSCNSNLDGINFGNRIDGENYVDTMIKTRTQNFGELVKKRFVIGSYSLKRENQEKLYLKAKKIRTLLIQAVANVFKKCDGFIFPAAAGIAPNIKDMVNKKPQLEDMKDILSDALLLANFAGLPSITIPMMKMKNMPVGISVNSDKFQENKCFNIAKEIEKVL